MTKQFGKGKPLNLLIALDLTEMDARLLRYVSFLCTKWNIQNLVFAHNIKKSALYSLYEELLREGIHVADIVERELKRTIAENYTGNCPYELSITSENNTESALTELVQQRKINLVITGSKREYQGTGVMTQKLIRMMPASLLLVPEETTERMERILVPTDFSPESARSFEAAMSLSAQAGGDIVALHVYGIPQFFFPYVDLEEAVDKTKLHLKERFAQFRKRHQLPADIQFKYLDKEESSTVETIVQEAVAGNFDLIVVSAKGANTLTTLFVGSTTNDLLVRPRRKPLLIVK